MDSITMNFSHIATLQIPVLNKQDRHIHISQEIRTAALISFGILCDYGCTIKLDTQEMPVQNNGQQIIKSTSKNQTGM